MLLLGNHHLQMASCLSCGGRAYALELEKLKSSSPTSTTTISRASNASSSSSTSSTLSESSNLGLAITTRKPRASRKRPKQTYNEAAALLSSAYPNLFPTGNTNSTTYKYSKPSPNDASFLSDDPSELFFPFRGIHDYSSTFFLSPEMLSNHCRPKLLSHSPSKMDSQPNCSSGSSNSIELRYDEDFDAESILDEDVDGGSIDSIMGNLSVKSEPTTTSYNGYPMGLGFSVGIGRRGVGVRAMRQADEGNWWSFPAVDMVELSRRLKKPAEKKSNGTKKKMKNVERQKSAEAVEPQPLAIAETAEKSNCFETEARLLLKLNYDAVLNAWSHKGSPFSDQAPGPDVQGNDVAVRLAQINLFPENEGVRPSKEKRRTRLFSKKIRYQVKKVNADRRLRVKSVNYS